MIAKAVIGSFATSLFAVLAPLAAIAATLVLGILVAVGWMSVVHGVLTRLDGGVGNGRLSAAERARPDDGSRT